MSSPQAQTPSLPWVVDRTGFPRPFGSYLLLASFAQGGMGEVYLAMHGGIAGASRLCVLKKLRRDVTSNAEYVNRFLDEARVVVTLNHANICHVFDVGCVDGEYYLAMEYVSGVNVKTLNATLAHKHAALPQSLSLYIVCELLKALDYAHRHCHPLTGKPLHVVHRDVSPQNVMLSYEGEVKLIDFGLAQSDLKVEETATGSVMGKVAYMSPEQARGEDVDPTCDQFAAAVVAYEIVTGDRFYGDMNHHSIWQVVGRGGFVPRRWHTLQPDLREILGKALASRPSQRYASCGELRDALGAYMGSHLSFTSERALREFLKGALSEAREQERQFVSQFAHLTPADVQDMTRESLASATSLVRAANAPAPQTWPPPAPAPFGAPPPVASAPSASTPLASPSSAPTEATQGASASTRSVLERAFLASSPEAGASEQTFLVGRAPLAQGSRAWLAGVVAGGVALALVGAFLVGRALDERDAAEPPTARAPTPPPPAPPPRVADEARAREPAPPSEAEAQEPAAPIAERDAERPAIAPAKPRPRRRSREPATAASNQKQIAAAERASQEPDARPPRSSGEARERAVQRDLKRKLDFLKQRCRKKCATRILEEYTTRPAVTEVPGFRKMIDRCVRDCRSG